MYQNYSVFSLADVVNTTEGVLMKALIAQRLVTMHPTDVLVSCDPNLQNVIDEVAVLGTKPGQKYQKDLATVGFYIILNLEV